MPWCWTHSSAPAPPWSRRSNWAIAVSASRSTRIMPRPPYHVFAPRPHPMAKESLTILEAELSLDAIGRALALSREDVLSKFRDPRVTSWFAEIWGERLFRYKKHLSSNHPGSDARLELGALGRF